MAPTTEVVLYIYAPHIHAQTHADTCGWLWFLHTHTHTHTHTLTHTHTQSRVSNSTAVVRRLKTVSVE